MISACRSEMFRKKNSIFPSLFIPNDVVLVGITLNCAVEKLTERAQWDYSYRKSLSVIQKTNIIFLNFQKRTLSKKWIVSNQPTSPSKVDSRRILKRKLKFENLSFSKVLVIFFQISNEWLISVYMYFSHDYIHVEIVCRKLFIFFTFKTLNAKNKTLFNSSSNMIDWIFLGHLTSSCSIPVFIFVYSHVKTAELLDRENIIYLSWDFE